MKEEPGRALFFILPPSSFLLPKVESVSMSVPRCSLTGPDLFRASSGSTEQRSPGEVLIYDLLASSLIHPEDWERISSADRDRLLRAQEKGKSLSLLVRAGLLTEYQAARIDAGTTFGLVLGNYRVLERIGSGGMAVVFKAEHVEMRHLVAIKVLHMVRGQDPRLETRFSSEMRAVARLRHPNIVTAIDAGRAFSTDPDGPVLWYLVMEYVPGQDLEEYVLSRGPLPVAKACNLAHQIACALAETARFNLVHRDIKPSNVLVTPEDQAKLLDFGLSRRGDHRMTQPGTILGTIDFMAPEQARDASTVDVRADIYGLGGTLFWCLTGQLPFATDGPVTELLVRRLTQPPPSVRAVLPSLPPELEAVVARMMALSPDDRPANPQAVMHALLPFLKQPSHPGIHQAHLRATLVAGGAQRDLSLGPSALNGASAGPEATERRHRVLIVDDEAMVREFCRAVLAADELVCDEASDGEEGLAKAAESPPDLVLLDINMPGLSGPEVLRRLRESPPSAHLKIIMFSGMASADEMAEMLLAGADDYLTKPFSVMQLQGRAQSALRLKDAQDRSDVLNARLRALNAELERSLSSRDGDLADIRNALVMALCKVVEHRENEGSGHLVRLRRYCRALAEAARQSPAFAGQIDERFIELLVCCTPLHDIGKVGLPDHILLKPGKLAPEERILMQAHTTIGAETLQEVAKQHGSMAFLQMAIEIVRHHHERFDGTGYPDRLAGSAIPLAARMVTICDVYDALRSRRSWKPALSHAAALQLMTEASPGQFDPALIQAFAAQTAEFDRIFREVPG
jgi:response regulator RpfG family c-di-GMP phosphodiesterase/serine/threonine protein kinase